MKKIFIFIVLLSMFGCSNTEEAGKNEHLIRDTIIASFFYNQGDILLKSKTKTKSNTKMSSATNTTTSPFGNGSITNSNTHTKIKTTSKSTTTSLGIGF